MAASTSRLTMLGNSGYTGPNKAMLVESFTGLLTNELRVLKYPEKTYSTLVNVVVNKVDQFLTSYFRRMYNLDSSEKCSDLAESMSEDSKELASLINLIMSMTDHGMNQFIFCSRNGTEAKPIMDLSCDRCPWYISNRFCILLNLEDAEDYEIHNFQFKVKESRYLALAILYTLHYIVGIENKDDSELVNSYMLFNHILTISKLYEQMNPTNKCWYGYLERAEVNLTSEPLNHDSQEYQFWDNILTSVFKDIQEGKLPYISDMYQSLKNNFNFIHSRFDNDKDPYYGMSASAQSSFTGERHSILSSPYEYDSVQNLAAEFDEFVGYESTYKQLDDLCDDNHKIYPIRTILIPNQGKFKPRIIHIAENAIQDRCNYIHRRTMKILDDLKCDCTRDQEEGRRFTQMLTFNWFYSEIPDRFGIYGTDFSDATDTLDQLFQRRVIEFIFGTQIATFWDRISKMAKFIQNYEDGSDKRGYHSYYQKCGQPQGLLGSFNCFALAHHFVFLMNMKYNNLEDTDPVDFYRVLGDDSIYNSVIPEITLLDGEDFTIIENIRRSPIEISHHRICKEFANWKINVKKSTSIHYNDTSAEIDFAKVTYRNGMLFTPLPFRLANQFASSTLNQFAVAIWRSQRNDPMANPIMDILLEKYPEYYEIVRGSNLPQFEYFKDPSVKLTKIFESRVNYSYAISLITTNLSFLIMNDQEIRSSSNFDDVLKALESLFKNKWESINNVSPKHKIFNVLDHNYRVIKLINDLYNYEDCDSRFIALALSPLGSELLNDEFYTLLRYAVDTQRVLNTLKKSDIRNDEELAIFPEFNLNWMETLKSLSQNLVLRGTVRKPKVEKILLEGTLKVLSELEDLIGPTDKIAG